MNYIKIISHMMRIDLLNIKSSIKNKLIDALIWGSCTLIVTAYVLGSFGLVNFGAFQAASVLISVIGFETYNQLFMLVMNIEQKKYLFYLFTLPIPVALIWLQKIISYTINGFILSSFMILVSKLVLQDQMPLTQINWPLLFLALIVSCFFFACFLLLMVSFVKKTSQVEHMFMRVVFPLWFFGGFQFSWNTLFSINKYAAYGALISPYTYATEAARVAFFGQEGFLPYWTCISFMFIAGCLLATIGHVRLKKRLALA